MGSTEGGNEIVERLFVHQTNGRKAEASSVLVAVEEVIFTDRKVEEVARRDAGRVVVVVIGACRAYLQIFGFVLVRRAQVI